VNVHLLTGLPASFRKRGACRKAKGEAQKSE
jgi:hypothetical protein